MVGMGQEILVGSVKGAVGVGAKTVGWKERQDVCVVYDVCMCLCVSMCVWIERSRNSKRRRGLLKRKERKGKRIIS